MLYGLTTTGSAVTLYAISHRTGVATPVGAGRQQFSALMGPKFVDIPVPGANFGFDFDPVADTIRVSTEGGLSFRIDPNTGAIIDGNGSPAGRPPDPQSGTGAAAYTNSFASAAATTLYHLRAADDTPSIQPGGGLTNILPVTLNGAPLDFVAVNGFDIPAGVAVGTTNAPAAGRAYAVLTVDGSTRLYGIDPATGAATDLGPVAGGTPVGGRAIQNDLGGVPAIALDAAGTNPVRFDTDADGFVSATVPVTGLAAGGGCWSASTSGRPPANCSGWPSTPGPTPPPCT